MNGLEINDFTCMDLKLAKGHTWLHTLILTIHTWLAVNILFFHLMIKHYKCIICLFKMFVLNSVVLFGNLDSGSFLSKLWSSKVFMSNLRISCQSSIILQVQQMHTFGQILVIVVPLVLSVMNLIWFSKIIKGLMKTLAKRQWKICLVKILSKLQYRLHCWYFSSSLHPVPPG